MPWPTSKPGRSAGAAGYGARHRRIRWQWAPLVATGTVVCWRCDDLIPAGAAWHLGHDDDDRTRYRGPEHAACNLSGASAKAHRLRWNTDPDPQPQTKW